MDELFLEKPANVSQEDFDIAISEGCQTEVGHKLDIRVEMTDDQILEKLGY